MRIDPPVSEPIAAGARPAATATADPLLEPPATRWTRVSHGFHGAPIGSLRPHPPKANSTMCVLPSGIIPAASSLSTAVAVSAATRPCQLFEPAVVTPVLDVQQILERDRQAVQRTAAQSGLALQIGCGRAIERGFAIDLDKRMRVSIERRNALEACGDDVVR